MEHIYDVVIIGGAFSGASMGLLLKRARPKTSVLIIERSVEYDRKVGESVSEVAGCFLAKVLHLSHYLDHHHLSKNGLRMFFTNDGNKSLAECTEIGAYYQTRLPSYQLDRSLLDQHLHDLAVKEGCESWRPAKVRELTLNGKAGQTLEVKVGDETRTVTARWVVDATGKASMIARKLGHWRKLESHPTNSLWGRFRNVADIDGYEIAKAYPNFASSVRVARGSATNHLMGRGWWCWIIPLANGDVSLGMTYDRRLCEPPEGENIPERLLNHVRKHPLGKALFDKAEPVEHDARAYSHLPYYTEQTIDEGWACVGDAAGFMDPLYSQGLDYCSHTVYGVHKLILKALDGMDVQPDIAAYNQLFRDSYHRWYQSIYHNKYHYLGDAELTNAAFLLDLASYFIGPVRAVYEDADKEFSMLPYSGMAGSMFARFMSLYNRRLSLIARKRWAAGTYGSMNLGHRFLVKQGFGPDFKIWRLFRTGLWIWARAEINAFFLPMPKEDAATKVTAPAEQTIPA